MRGTFLERLTIGRPLLADGAMGTMLIAQGLPSGESPDRWVLERPEAVLAVHRAYRQAGAQVLLTDTFGANRFRLRGWSGGAIGELTARAVELARQAAGREAWVALSVGPTGVFLEPAR
ncbi:MAG: hypothetical protein KatS3mg115_2358 [Candidatus Poribacteria bacterium]|nr:MAG: hypothetical protein KatS3mg115_2358 [Candidatus Poribacteria bacterium]